VKPLYIFNQNEELVTILKPDSTVTRTVTEDYTQTATMFTGGDAKVIESSSCPYKEAPHTEQLNKENFFQFWVPADHEDSQYVKEENLVAFKDEDGAIRLFVIKELDEVHDDILYKEVFCQAAWIDELNDEPIEDIRPQNTTALDALTKALNTKRWQVGTVADLGLNSTNFYYESTVFAIQKILNTWGGEVRDRIVITDNKISARYIDILARRGADTGKRFEITKDITSIKRTVLSYPKTALYGRGKGEQTEDGFGRRITFADVSWSVANGDPVDKPLGQEWVGDPEALEQFGRLNTDGTKRHRFGFFDSSDEEDKVKLLQDTWDDLQRRKVPLVNYELSVITLEHITGYEHEKVRLGDTVFVIDRYFTPAILVEARVIEIKRYLNEPERTQVKLGNFLPMFTEEARLERVESRLNDGAGRWDSPVTDIDFPNTVPPMPTGFLAYGSFKKIILVWDYNSTSYIAAYEVYASQVPDFIPDSSNLVFRGKTGGYVHNADTDQQWYFRIRSINTRGTSSDYSAQITVSTVSIANKDIAPLTITNALIAETAAIDFAKIAKVLIVEAMIDKLAVVDGHIRNISGDKVDAGKVKTMFLDVTGTTNVVSNWEFSVDGGVTGSTYDWAGSIHVTSAPPTGSPTPFTGRQTGRDVYAGGEFAVTPGESFYVAGWACNGDSPHGFNMGMFFTDGAATPQRTWITPVNWSSADTAWTFKEAMVTAPSWAVRGRCFYQIPSFDTFGNWYFTRTIVRRSGKITADQIIAGQIAAEYLRAKRIYAGTTDDKGFGMDGTSFKAYDGVNVGGRTLLDIYDTVPTLWNGDNASGNVKVTAYGKLYSQNFQIFIPSGTYNPGSVVSQVVSIKDYAEVAIPVTGIMSIQFSTLSKEMYVYEEAGSRTNSGGDLTGLTVRLSPHYGWTSAGVYADVNMTILGYR
jgi:phage minor structural protein